MTTSSLPRSWLISIVFGLALAGCAEDVIATPDGAAELDGGDEPTDAGRRRDGGPRSDAASPDDAGDPGDAALRDDAGGPTCGDGIVTSPEECDDANTGSGDGCSASCRVEAPADCGDGTLDFAAGEQCDDGNLALGDGCGATCQLEPLGTSCGDSTIGALEVCDDGNTSGGDGCNPTCNLRGATSLFVGAVGTSARVDGVGPAARIRGNGTLAADAQYLWLAEAGDATTRAALRRIEISSGNVLTVATLSGPAAEGIATNGTDTVWIATSDATGPAIVSVSTSPPYAVTRVTGSAACASAACYADGAPGTATFSGIRGLTWYAGDLWIVDPEAATIRRLDLTTSAVTTIAGQAFQYGASDGVGNAARFNSPRYLVSDNSGVLYVSDTNGQAIRTLTVASARVGTFAGIPVDRAGAPAATYVDGVGTSARIHRPRAITTDGTSIYFAEFNFHTVRQGVLATQDVSTLAGMPMATGGYAEGTGSAARFDGPWGLAYHAPTASLFVVDGANEVIRRIR